MLFDVATQAFGDPTAKEIEPLKKPAVLAYIPSISKGNEVAINDKVEEDLDNSGLEGKEPKEERPDKEKERQYMCFDEIAEAVAPMLDELISLSSGIRIIA